VQVNISAWFRSKSWTAHTVAAGLVTLAGIVALDPQAQRFITALFKGHPEAVSEIILFAGLVAKYSQSSSPAGTMATARVIADKPDAPTASEVERASAK
jgi:hypothetical protein